MTLGLAALSIACTAWIQRFHKGSGYFSIRGDVDWQVYFLHPAYGDIVVHPIAVVDCCAALQLAAIVEVGRIQLRRRTRSITRLESQQNRRSTVSLAV